jgi:hypothetical protein
MGLNADWEIYYKKDSSVFQEASVFNYRNRIGIPVVSVTSTDYGTPGVLRCTVTGVSGSDATIVVKTINADDSKHPSINESGVTVTMGETTNDIMYGLDIELHQSLSVGDQFDIAYGYVWNDDNSRWDASQAFGIVIPGDFSDIIYMTVKNVGDTEKAMCELSWSNDGPYMLQAKLVDVDGAWTTDLSQPLSLMDANGVDGYFAPNGECDVELRLAVPASADASYNMMIFTMTMASVNIGAVS